MTLPRIEDVHAYPAGHLPGCQHYTDFRGRCGAVATMHMVAPDGTAVSTYCQAHADTTIAEYDAAAAANPDLVTILAGWRAVPVAVLP